MDNLPRKAIANDRLAQLVNINDFVLLRLRFGRPIYPINIMEEHLDRVYQFAISRTSQELQWFDGIGAKGNCRIRDDMRNQVASWKIVIRRRRVAMGRWHHEWCISRWKFIHRLRAVLLGANGRLDRTGQRRILHHFSELVHIVTRIVAMGIPNIQKLIESSMVLWVFLSIVGRRETKQIDNIWLQGSGQGGESDGGIQMVFGVVIQVVQ